MSNLFETNRSDKQKTIESEHSNCSDHVNGNFYIMSIKFDYVEQFIRIMSLEYEDVNCSDHVDRISHSNKYWNHVNMI